MCDLLRLLNRPDDKPVIIMSLNNSLVTEIQMRSIDLVRTQPGRRGGHDHRMNFICGKKINLPFIDWRIVSDYLLKGLFTLQYISPKRPVTLSSDEELSRYIDGKIGLSDVTLNSQKV